MNGRAPLVTLVLATSLLAGCGGSDGGSDGTSALDLPGIGVLSQYFVKSFDAFETAAATLRDSNPRYTVQENTWTFGPGFPTFDSYPLAASRFEYAHAAGLTGAGQLVAIMDEGFRASHEVFGSTTILGSGFPTDDDHGTSVASIVAGSSADFIGVAPGASLLLSSYDSGFSAMAAATNTARALGAVAQNNSWGYELAANENTFDKLFGGGSGKDYYRALEKYAREGVVVFAVSNDESRTKAAIMEGLPLLRPELESGWLAVVNAVPTFNNDRILSARLISSPCLEAARWCLAADGTWNAATASSDTSYSLDDSTLAVGTSFAAPQVAGALALLAEAFPRLTPHQLRIRLLASADNSFFKADGRQELARGFFHGYSEKYGHGFLDVRAALLPIGDTSVRMKRGGKRGIDRPLVVSGAATGDAVKRSLGNVAVLATDSLGGDFAVPADAMVAQVNPPPLAPEMLDRAMGGDLRALRVSLVPTSGGMLDAMPGRTLGMTTPDGGFSTRVLVPSDSASEDEYGAAVQRNFDVPGGSFAVGLTFGAEGGSVLGIGDGLGNASSNPMVALDIGLVQENSAGSFFRVGGQFGVASLQDTGLSGLDSAAFNSLSFDVGQRNLARAGDRLTLGVALPIALTSGQGSMSLPTGRSATGVIYTDVPVDLAPDDRQLDLSITYQVPLGERSEMIFQATQATNQGNVAGASETAGVIGYRIVF